MIEILITLAVIGLLAWAVLTYIPMAEPFPKIFIAVLVIGTILWLLNAFGILDGPFPNRVRLR